MTQMLGGGGHAVNHERAQHSGARTEATHGQAAAGSQGIPVSVALPDHRSCEPGVGGNITHISIGRGFFYLVAIIEQRVRSSPWLVSDAIVCRKRNRCSALFSALFDSIAPNGHDYRSKSPRQAAMKSFFGCELLHYQPRLSVPTSDAQALAVRPPR
jgi:hypothetical protein